MDGGGGSARRLQIRGGVWVGFGCVPRKAKSTPCRENGIRDPCPARELSPDHCRAGCGWRRERAHRLGARDYHPPTSKFGQPPQHSTTTQGAQPGQNSTQSRCDRQRHWGYWGSSPTLLRSNHAGQLVCHHGGVVRLQVQPEMHAIQGCRVQTRPAWPHPAMVVWWTSSSVAGDTTGLWYEGSGTGALGGCTSCHCRGP